MADEQEKDTQVQSPPTTPKIERKPGESMRAYCDRILEAAGSIDMTSKTPGTVSTMIGTTLRLKRTAEEQQILDMVAKTEGQAWVDRHAELILDQARSIGDL